MRSIAVSLPVNVGRARMPRIEKRTSSGFIDRQSRGRSLAAALCSGTVTRLLYEPSARLEIDDRREVRRPDGERAVPMAGQRIGGRLSRVPGLRSAEEEEQRGGEAGNPVRDREPGEHPEVGARAGAHDAGQPMRSRGAQERGGGKG